MLSGGRVETGLEVEVAEGCIQSVRPWSSAARAESGLLLSPAFVNAHSHLEYYDLLGKMPDLEYWSWIREITRIKQSRKFESVEGAAVSAAFANIATGVSAIGEWSDWPVSAAALTEARLDGRLFQEVITLAEADREEEKLEACTQKAAKAAQHSRLPVHITPHASYTTSRTVLQESARSSQPQSIHVCETEHENQFFEHGTGVIADFYRSMSIPFDAPGLRTVPYLDSLGLLKPTTQLVHCCAINESDIQIIARSGATAAHCPRSNRALGCPPAPVASLLRAGVSVGLGLDSAASSGPIDMFAEMRSALSTSALIDDSLSASQVWSMATELSAASIFLSREWRIEAGLRPDLLLLSYRGDLDAQIREGSPEDVCDLIRMT